MLKLGYMDLILNLDSEQNVNVVTLMAAEEKIQIKI